jgi:gas vesicle protein
MPIFPKKVDAKKMYNTNKPLTYNKLDTSSLPKFKGGTAPGFGRVAKGFNIIKSFFQAPKQYLSRSGFVGSNLSSGITQLSKKFTQNPKSFVQQVKSSRKTNREKVTKMSEKFFKNVQNQMEKNPKLTKSSPGYFTFKK